MSDPLARRATHGLPAPLTRLIGRERELAAVVDAFGTARLLTLTGPGGTGKTRLGISLAERVAPAFPDGIAWIELAALEDATSLTQHVALAVGKVDWTTGTPLDALVDALRDRRLFMVLDNCEHVVESCALLVEVLLPSCPQLRIVATSREALGIPGETAWLVPPLRLPPAGGSAGAAAEAVAASEAGQLFLERAQAVLPDFRIEPHNATAVARILRELDGIPLALELAAARIRLMPPSQIAERLHDAFRLLTSGARTALPRHRTLRATIDWSYDLLTEPERRMLERLAVFTGGFSLEAAERVTADDTIAADDVLDLLAALVDKSLVVLQERGGAARYRLLETVRQYAVERLDAHGDAATVRARHGAFYCAFAEAMAPALFCGAGDAAAIAAVDLEVENLRTAAAWAGADPARTEIALRLGVAIHWYLYARAWFREGRADLEAALRADVAIPGALRGRALTALAQLCFAQGDPMAARAAAREATPLLADDPDVEAYAYALCERAMAERLSGSDVPYRPLLDAAERLLLDRPDGVLHVFVDYWQARLAWVDADLPFAREHLERALPRARRVAHRPAVGHSAGLLARILIDLGDEPAAAPLLLEALGIHRETGDQFGGIQAIEDVARVASRHADHTHALRCATIARSLRAATGMATTPEEGERLDAVERDALTALGAEAAAAVRAEAALLDYDQAMALALHEAKRCAAAVPAPVETPVAPASASPEASGLDVRALGPMRILRDGTMLGADVWSSAKARELLLMLLCHPEGRTKEQVGVAFWPDASAAQVRNAFHVTLHRLRKALGDGGWIVIEGDRYRLAPGRPVRFDLPEFVRETQAAERRLAAGDAGADAALGDLLAGYEGDFLADALAGDWHLELRDQAHRRCLDAATALGHARMERSAWAEAADAWRVVLLRDPLHEGAVRALMRCHTELGERSQALTVFRRLRDRLREELEAEPEAATLALRDALQAPA